MKCTYTNLDRKCLFSAKYGDYCGYHVYKYLNDLNFLKKNFSSLRIKMLNDIDIFNKLILKKYFKCTSLKKFLLILKKYSNKKDIEKIIKIQSYIRGKFIRDIYGPCFTKRTLSVNDTDISGIRFWNTINNKKFPVNEINNNYYFSFKEKNVYYAFDVLSFNEILKLNKKNPYSNYRLSYKVIKNFEKKLRYMHIHKLFKNQFTTNNYSIEQKKQFKLMKIINKIEQNVGYLINPKWFLDLNMYQLKNYYVILLNIWNQDINFEQKQQYYDGTVFYYTSISLPLHKNRLYDIIMDVLFKLIIEQTQESILNQASMFILTALTYVSNDAKNSLPFSV